MMQIESCVCPGPFPLTTLEAKKMRLAEAERVDAILPEGRWHAVRIGKDGPVHLIQLVIESSERIAEKQAQQQATEQQRLAEAQAAADKEAARLRVLAALQKADPTLTLDDLKKSLE